MKRSNVLIMFVILSIGITVGLVVQSRADLAGRLLGAQSLHDDHDLLENDAHDEHGHAHGEGNSTQITVWDDRFEIFLEHPAVVVGVPADFVTHVSYLESGEPRKEGYVTFLMQQGTEPVVEHQEAAPARDGIYIPHLLFPKPGQWSLSLLIPTSEGDHKIELGSVTVYASEHDAEDAPIIEPQEGISFLKEQQWVLRTLTDVVRNRSIAGRNVLALPESALANEYDEHVVYIQLSGETFEERHVLVSKSMDGLVEVSSGVSEGERVLTKGAHALAYAELIGGSEDAVHAHEEVLVQFDPESLEKFDIEISEAGPAGIDTKVRLTGEIALNTDRVVHIVPTVPGIVREVHASVGDRVKAGDVIAWLESTEMGQAKAQYLSGLAEMSCCSVELPRAQEIHKNTTALLSLLADSPSLDALGQLGGGAMGKNRSDLISTYTEFVFARNAHQREKQLWEKEITSEEDYLKAQGAWKKAEANYEALRDTITFNTTHDLMEARQAQRLREINLQSARRSLYILGLATDDVDRLQILAQSSSGAAGAEVCTDPNCTECARNESSSSNVGIENSHDADQKLAWYPLRAPLDGTIIDKHITLGESIKDDSAVFEVADLSTVWIDFQVHSDDLASIREGQKVVISGVMDSTEVQAAIQYISPLVNHDTRTVFARAVVPNTSGQFRPGQFVSGLVEVTNTMVDVAVERSSIQYVEDQPCVYVQTVDGFEKRNVELGRSNGALVEILSGLESGEKIVARNSFHIKTESEKDKVAAGGHGHAH